MVRLTEIVRELQEDLDDYLRDALNDGLENGEWVQQINTIYNAAYGESLPDDIKLE